MAVSDDAEAFTQAWLVHPDIIVTELSVPGFDGWAFIRDVKRDARTRDIPIVIVSSDGQAGAREQADRAGCSGFLLKPCLPEDLASALRRVLNHAYELVGDD
jgi:CheY-like chemotaxis protein